MGCASSKKLRCRNCQSPHTPARHSYTMHVHVHHPPERHGDSHHLVALTSTTLGSLKIESAAADGNGFVNSCEIEEEEEKKSDGRDEQNREKEGRDFSMALVEAKTWSNLINEKISKVVPKTPVVTPPGEPETINAWELMEGLEDVSPLKPRHARSFSFDIVRDTNPLVPFDLPKSRLQESSVAPSGEALVEKEENGLNSKLLEVEKETNSPNSPQAIVSGVDPEVNSDFKKSLPDNPFHLTSEEPEPVSTIDEKMVNQGDDMNYKCVKEKVRIYFTSLRGVRKTYEDCCHVRVILKGLGLRVDERDVSMHSGFKDELKELMGVGFYRGVLPRVFVGKKYIGGAEEIRRMHEEGKLQKVLEGCEMAEDGIGGNVACKACGDIRFVPCVTCSGSCKIYFDGEEGEGEEVEYGFQRCPDCNENGLVRCPICCD